MKYRIRTKKPWIAYPGSTVQQNYAEETQHGFLLWDIDSRDEFNVSFKELPNPKPFVTIGWTGNVTETLRLAKSHPIGTRFRIRSEAKLPSKDSMELMRVLKKDHNATEVTFKDNHYVDRSQVSTGVVTLAKDDLRNPDVLLRLLKEHYTGADMQEEEWHVVYDLLKRYSTKITVEAPPRNISWHIRRLEFDNLFGYGKDNIINFDKLSGVVGIFGPNRSGKSSIPGTLMYTLFNSTDRGSIKNKDVINCRATEGRGRIIFNVSGVDYVAERKTTKTTTKTGSQYASTDLQLYRVLKNEVVPITGEQRPDTDKKLRRLIGTPEDFLLTTLSSQDGAKMFLEQGTAKRNQVLSRFLDVDILHAIHSLARDDVKDHRAVLKSMPDLDWEQTERDKRNNIQAFEDSVKEVTKKIQLKQSEVQQLRTQLAMHAGVMPVTKSDVNQQEHEVTRIKSLIERKEADIEKLSNDMDSNKQKLLKLDQVLGMYDIGDLRASISAYRKSKSAIDSAKNAYDTETATLKRHRHTLKVLDAVPCGNEYPTCKFIKEAHQTKEKVDPQEKKVKAAKSKLEEASKALEGVDIKKLEDNLKKVEQLKDRASHLKLLESNMVTERVRYASELSSLEDQSQAAEARLDELQDALYNDENEEVASLRGKITSLETELQLLETQKLSAASSAGRIQSELEQLLKDKAARSRALQQMKAHEVIAMSFSKKGIPNLIMMSQLPVINAEISKILNGVVNFEVELEKNVDSDQIDIILNYGDSRRILELGSGHEKTISSIALRVALMNTSTLPKTDILIIDEGFGTFDPQGIDEVNRLISSISRQFKAVLIITHVDNVKETADTIIEITKSEKDSKVTYE